MPRQSRTRLAPPKTEPAKQALEPIEEPSVLEQKEETVLNELENEIQCPRCNEIMELCSSFDKLMYSCDNCSFILKCG
jgi:Zn finger protein HypA/HybF involved in hydrogenase expression